MSTRRPRVKAAAILKPRRPLTSNEPNTEKTNPKSDPEEITNESNDSPNYVDNDELASSQEPKVWAASTPDTVAKIPSSPIKSKIKSLVGESVENKPPGDTSPLKFVTKPTNSVPIPSPFRGKITPCIVNRRKSLIAADNRPGCVSPKYIRSPSYSFIRDVQIKETKPNTSPLHSANSKPANCDDELFSPIPIDNEECFKSPFMSPIYTRRVDPSMSPFHDVYGEDCTKSPSQLNNSKLPQRIRPTPCFASRRNSIQGNSLGGASESEDEQHRRQRHYSTSSNHSNYNPASTPQYQRNYFGLNKLPSRVRTESFSSSASDIPYSKNRRSNRSEEYQRVANAKREFNQRLNGKPPDRSRLTMYDLIYYNPLTNPMSKPAGKGDKNSDSASVASGRTNRSRASDSVKSEASVKTERSENTEAVTGPVPQLKLDANGEIILDEKSLVIETTGEKEARESLANSDVVYDDEFSGTSGFYKRQKRTRDWAPLETLKFYRSLQTIGTDFSVMLQLFPNRSRRDLKLKFKKEEKHNMALINKALLHPKEFNVDELKVQFDKEDEEIELKKQEWAEVRKKMATERREQLNASRRRNPNKQVSRSMRGLTDGDLIYENEFVTLPRKTNRPRKRAMVDAIAAMVRGTPDDVFSPSPLNHNNNHVDTLPHHTYATHKLPRFIEMMSSQKIHSDPASNPNLIHTGSLSASIKYPAHSDHVQANIESNGTFDNDENSVHAIDLSTTSGSLVIHRSNKRLSIDSRPNIDANVQFASDPTISQYIAKNPNLTFKGSGDIMDMDIIFENVSIEEDASIGSTRSSTSNAEESVEVELEAIHEPATVEDVNIDGVHYQIITIENASEKDEHLYEPDQLSTEAISIDYEPAVGLVEEVVAHEDVVDYSTMPVISQKNQSPPAVGCLIDTHEMPNFGVAAEIETGDATELQLPVVDVPVASSINVEQRPSNAERFTTKTDSVISHATVQNTNSSTSDRKRKRKVVPVLANIKRTQRNNVNRTADQHTQQPVGQNVPYKLESDAETQSHQNKVETTQPIQSTQETDSSCSEQVTEQTLYRCKTDNQIKDEPKTNVDTPERNSMDSLVVVESQDPNDPTRTIHEVYIVDPDTNEMSEKPLDLPDHVIQRIRLAIS